MSLPRIMALQRSSSSWPIKSKDAPSWVHVGSFEYVTQCVYICVCGFCECWIVSHIQSKSHEVLVLRHRETWGKSLDDKKSFFN